MKLRGLNVSENTALLSFYRLRAHDSDSGSYGEVVYSIDSPDGVFIVDAKVRDCFTVLYY